VKNILLNIFFVLLIKSDTRVVRARLPFPKMETRLVLSPEIDWSIWAKKQAAIKMGFEDNHGWSSESAPARVFLGQIRSCIFIVIRVQFS
jgi:hypothetical protein